MHHVFALSILALCQAQENPFASDPKAAETARPMFRILCAPCHGLTAEGGRGPDLTLGTYNAGDQDRDLYRVIARGVTGSEMQAYAGRLEDKAIWRLVAYIRSVGHKETTPIAGDAANGEKLFWGKGACGQCHKAGVKGNSIGPDLTLVGRQRSLAYLRASLLTPDADITPGYTTVTVVKPDGTKVIGVERSFDNFSAQLVDLSGHYHSFVREDVTSMKRELRSLMPSYANTFSREELNDILVYLSGLRGAK